MKIPESRTTHHNITSLEPNQIFVFGSNEGGKHGAGAAKQAMKWGAKWGTAEGLAGQTYAIPTKNFLITKTLSVSKIGGYIDNFVEFARQRPDLEFLVTEIGCGLAGLTPEQVAPLFAESRAVPNVKLPARFIKILNK